MKNFFGVVVLGLVLVQVLGGCTQSKASSSQEAIQQSKTLQTVEEKAKYLIGQAKAFYNSKEFQGAVDIAQHILRYVDKESGQAKDLLEKAKQALIAKAQEAAGSATTDIKKKIGDFGQ